MLWKMELTIDWSITRKRINSLVVYVWDWWGSSYVSFSYDFWSNQIVGFNWRKRLVCTLVDDVGFLFFFLTKLMFLKSWDVIILALPVYHVVPTRSKEEKIRPRSWHWPRFIQHISASWTPSPLLFFIRRVFTQNLLFLFRVIDGELSEIIPLTIHRCQSEIRLIGHFCNERMFRRIGLIRLHGHSMLFFVSISGIFLDYHVVLVCVFMHSRPSNDPNELLHWWKWAAVPRIPHASMSISRSIFKVNLKRFDGQACRSVYLWLSRFFLNPMMKLDRRFCREIGRS